MLPQLLISFTFVVYSNAIPTPYGYVPAAPPLKIAVPQKLVYPIEKPQPYNFAYDIKDEEGNTQWRKETGDEYGSKEGTYGYVDASGIRREVDYVAGPDGFRAWIKTNEPGTMTSNPADVQIVSEEAPAKPTVYVPKLLKPVAKVPLVPTKYSYGLPYVPPKIVYGHGLAAPKPAFHQVVPVAYRPVVPHFYPQKAFVKKL